MKKLILALAFAPTLLVGVAQAQTVSDDVHKQLWCGTALVVAYSTIPADAEQAMLDDQKAYTEAGTALIDTATKAHLDAGFTQEAVDKLKADLIAAITPIVTEGGDASKAEYTFGDCDALVHPPAPADASSSAM